MGAGDEENTSVKKTCEIYELIQRSSFWEQLKTLWENYCGLGKATEFTITTACKVLFQDIILYLDGTKEYMLLNFHGNGSEYSFKFLKDKTLVEVYDVKNIQISNAECELKFNKLHSFPVKNEKFRYEVCFRGNKITDLKGWCDVTEESKTDILSISPEKHGVVVYTKGNIVNDPIHIAKSLEKFPEVLMEIKKFKNEINIVLPESFNLFKNSLNLQTSNLVF